MQGEYEQIEETMILNDRYEHVYERDQRLYSCTRLEDTMFVHRALGTHYGALMSSLGFHEFTNEQCAQPDLPYLKEWFWPHMTYRQAEWLLSQREENMVLIRMSESNPGHFALTAGKCASLLARKDGSVSSNFTYNFIITYHIIIVKLDNFCSVERHREQSIQALPHQASRRKTIPTGEK